MRTVTDEFKREAVRLVQTSGRTIGQIDDDLGIGHSTLERRALNMRRDARASIERAAKRAEARARRGANIKLDQHASYLTLAGLGKWLAKHREAELLAGPHEDTAKELARLRKENEILRAERDLLKKLRPSSPSACASATSSNATAPARPPALNARADFYGHHPTDTGYPAAFSFNEYGAVLRCSLFLRWIEGSKL